MTPLPLSLSLIPLSSSRHSFSLLFCAKCFLYSLVRRKLLLRWSFRSYISKRIYSLIPLSPSIVFIKFSLLLLFFERRNKFVRRQFVRKFVTIELDFAKFRQSGGINTRGTRTNTIKGRTKEHERWRARERKLLRQKHFSTQCWGTNRATVYDYRQVATVPL